MMIIVCRSRFLQKNAEEACKKISLSSITFRLNSTLETQNGIQILYNEGELPSVCVALIALGQMRYDGGILLVKNLVESELKNQSAGVYRGLLEKFQKTGTDDE